jgi:hypothetical protein
MSIDAAVARLFQALEVLRKASPSSLAPHADALKAALETIAELVKDVEQSDAEPLASCH